MLADVTIDGRTEAEFRLAIEALLRNGAADEAAHILKGELSRLSGQGHPLPARFQSISAAELEVEGWDCAIARIDELDRPGDPITAIGLDICGMDIAAIQAGFASPVLTFETTYYTDQAWGFSHAERAGICAGYQGTGHAWQGGFEDIDDALRVTGLDDLNAVLAALEQHCHAGRATDAERQALVVGACYLAVLVHQAVRDKALTEGLPRAMAVLVGSNQCYPGFEAPALTARDSVPRRAAKTSADAIYERRTGEPSLIGRAIAPAASPPAPPLSAAAPPIAFGIEPASARHAHDLGAIDPARPWGDAPQPLFGADRAPFAPPPGFARLGDSLAGARPEEAPAGISFPAARQPEAEPFAQPEADDWHPGETEEDFGEMPLEPMLQPESPAYSGAGAETDDGAYASLDPARSAGAQGMAEPAGDAPDGEEEALHLPPPGIHVTGTQLRRRFVDRDAVVIEDERRPTLLERLLERLIRRR